jgi:hypothetical protein
MQMPKGKRGTAPHSALDGGKWSASRPGRVLPPVIGPPVPIVQETGWASEPVWTTEFEIFGNIKCFQGFKLFIVNYPSIMTGKSKIVNTWS